MNALAVLVLGVLPGGLMALCARAITSLWLVDAQLNRIPCLDWFLLVSGGGLIGDPVAGQFAFVSDRIFVLGPKRLLPKSVGWRLIELLAFTAVTAVSWPSAGNSPRSSESLALGICGCVVCVATFAFPGFVWRYLRRH